MEVTSDIGRLDCYVPAMLLGRLASRPRDLVEVLDGTMVFADVCGFTRLSERLARAGKEGAEHLVEAINACFSALLADADKHGGSLLKFGGDAMLLWFDGEQHARRACGCAVAMRRSLREVGRIHAGASNVVLRMSVGVHSGSYAMFLVGGSHRELLIGGSATNTVIATESAASAGQIVVSADTAERLPRSCIGARAGPGALLARSPDVNDLAPCEGLARPSDKQIAGCLSTALRAHLLAGHSAPEHRTATIAFLQFGALDRLIADHGPERAAAQLDELVRLVQDAVERYDLCFLDSDISSGGVKIRLSAGAPRVLGEDEERLLLALRQIVEAAPPLPVQAGVNRGPVFTGELGPPFRRWYAVMGDTVNVAARLTTMAPVGHVYATRGVLQRAKTSLEQTPLEPFAVKGKSRPVQAWDVGPPRRAAPRGLAGRQLPVIGRQREIDLLRFAIGEALRGSGTLIELVGDTGIGKTRLLAEAAKLGEGRVTLHATCEVYSRETPYACWRDLLRQLLRLSWNDPEDVVLSRLETELRRTQPDLLPWLALIAIVLDVEAPSSIEVQQLAPESRAGKLHEVMLRFLGRALVVPTLVEIEHAHLMDTASSALFEALTRELESSAWVVLLTRRDVRGGTSLPGHRHLQIQLGPLSPEEAQTLALATPEASQLPPHAVEVAVERSGGSPAFLLDLLAAAAAGNRDELPDSITAATMARIDTLDPRDGAVVRRAAVLGLSFHPRRFVDVVSPDLPLPEEGFWDRLPDVFVREADGHVRFTRPALQEAAYASLPFKLRRKLHAAVGRTLERDHGREPDADPAALSRHFALAGDHARAHRYAMLAANRAAERFSHADAARLYRRAIDAARAHGLGAEPDGGAALAEAWEQLGEALRCTGERAAATRALTEARRLRRDDPIAQARLCYRHAEVAHGSEAETVAVRWLMRGFRCIEGLQDTEATAWRARMRAYLGSVRSRQGRWSLATSACRQAISEAESVGELRALAHACYALDWALVESGRPREATHSARALEIYRQLGDPEHESAVLNNLGMFAYLDGRWDDAVELYRKSAAASERAGRPGDVAVTDCNVGEILSDQGRLDEAEAYLRRARRVWSATEERQAVAFVDVLLGRLAVRRNHDRAGTGVSMLEAAISEFRTLGLDVYADLAQALIAEAEAITGNASRAIQIARRELQTADRHRPLLARISGIALARLGRAEAAVGQLNDALVAARERDAAYEIAATIDVLDSLGVADRQLVRERDEILRRLQVERLPTPPLAPRPGGPPSGESAHNT